MSFIKHLFSCENYHTIAIIFKNNEHSYYSMGWERTLATEELICFEEKAKTVSTRIESRKSDDGWAIYKTYYNESGINYTDEFTATTFEKMSQIVKAIQKEKRPTVTQLRKLMLDKSKKVQIKVERAFKEYNVEKWKFGVNSDGLLNFALVRCYDQIDLDIVMHESYKMQEVAITTKILQILGFEEMEDVLTVNVYYFSKISEQKFESKNEPEIEFL